jgi:disulfide bond formation protein DsbB
MDIEKEEPFLAHLSNYLEILGVVILLFMALYFQFVLHELPCPLCLLQRVGFLGIAIALLLNFRFGQRPSHYALALLFSLFVAFVALRQIVLHIVPGSGSYGSAIFGLHMYTWSFIIAMLIAIGATVTLGLDKQYYRQNILHPALRPAVHLLFAVTLIVTVIMLVSVFAECGLAQCPDNPVHYLLSSAASYVSAHLA